MSKYVIVDLEMCHVPKGIMRDAFGAASELIEIGAVLVGEDYKIEDTFMTYVRPEFGSVDTFIEELTGISQKDVENAPSTKDALAAFCGWLPDDAVLMSWSYTDEDQLIDEIDGKDLDFPRLEDAFDEWVDCQEMFAEKMNTDRSYKLSEALNLTAIPYDEGEHDALVDAKNTALLFIKMQTESELGLSPYLIG